jgi:ribose-phosphate pyrophosphokinase
VTSNLLILSTRTYRDHAERIAGRLRAESGAIYRKSFPDGEHYMRLDVDVRGRDVALVGGTISDSDTLEVYDVASAVVKYGARSLTLVVPYFGYATMERATAAGEIVTAKNRARLLSSLPSGDTPNRVLLFDVHTEGLPYYFEGSIVPTHVYGKQIILERIHEIAPDLSTLVLACTDAGRAKWVESLANDLGVAASFVFKKRLDGETTRVMAVSAQVEGKHVVVYDDMIRTGGSLMGAAQAYRDAGARQISAICTHGLFPGDSLAKLQRSGLFHSISATDSHPRAVELGGEFLHLLDTAPLFAAQLEATQSTTG